MRLASKSVIIPSISHAVWNTLAYGLFGFGEKTGILGTENTIIFGPEVGVIGIILNGMYLIWLVKKTAILVKKI
jgi:hypothetical protein